MGPVCTAVSWHPVSMASSGMPSSDLGMRSVCPSSDLGVALYDEHRVIPGQAAYNTLTLLPICPPDPRDLALTGFRAKCVPGKEEACSVCVPRRWSCQGENSQALPESRHSQSPSQAPPHNPLPLWTPNQQVEDRTVLRMPCDKV